MMYVLRGAMVLIVLLIGIEGTELLTVRGAPLNAKFCISELGIVTGRHGLIGSIIQFEPQVQ